MHYPLTKNSANLKKDLDSHSPASQNVLITRGSKTTLIGILSSFILSCVKIISGILGNSYALIADGIESLADVFTSFVVLSGLRIASKPADLNHPYGHGKAEPIAGAIVAMALFAAAIIIIIQSIYEIITPHHAPAPFTLLVLILVVITKEILYRYVIKVGKDINSIAIINEAWHHRSDAITSVAAFIGISVALIGGVGFEVADDYAALFASVIIILNAYRLLKPTLYELMDTAPSESTIQKIRNCAQQVEGVMGLDKCYVRKMGLNFIVDIHVIVDGDLSVYKGHSVAHRVKDTLMTSYSNITDVLVHIEPMVLRKEDLK